MQDGIRSAGQLQLVKQSNPQPAITDLIDGWYAVAAVPPEQDNNWAPPEWKVGVTGSAATEPLYRDVVGRSCRTCHVAFSSDAGLGLNWNDYLLQFAPNRGGIRYAVCNAKYMPHALMTYRNFWLSASPHQPTVLETFAGPSWAAFPPGTCQ